MRSSNGPISRRRVLLVGGGAAAGLLLADTRLARADEDVVEIRMAGNARGSRVWFDPVGLWLRPGQTVRWINADQGNAHTATAYHPSNGGRPLRMPQGAEPWDSGYLLPDESFETILEEIGVYDYFCVPHEMAGMVGRLVVAPPGLTVPSTRIPHLPYDDASDLPEAARAILPAVEDVLARGRIQGG